MASPKITLKNAELTVYPTDARALITYNVDFTDTKTSDQIIQSQGDMLNLAQASVGMPVINDQTGFTPVAGPNIPNGAQASTNLNYIATTLTTHQMRVYSKTARPLGGIGTYQYEVDVVYQSRPRPMLEYGASSQQVKTTTYLNPGLPGVANQDNPLGFVRTQMTLDWFAKAGTYNRDANGNLVIPGDLFPATDVQFLFQPVQGTRMQFQASMRISSTFYSDEMTQGDLALIIESFSDTTNNADILFPGDRTYWLLTTVNGVSNDGGYSTRVSAEWVFNLDGWDTLAVYTFNGQPALIDPAIARQLYTPLPAPTGGSRIPSPYNPPHGGAGRFPQQELANHVQFLKWVSQSSNPPLTVSQLLSES